MEAVGARAGDQSDFRARTAAGVGAAVAGGGAELLHRVGGHAQDTGKGRAAGLRGDVGAVERNVRLVAPSAVDGAVAVVAVVARTVAPAGEVGDARLEREQVGDVARERRQFHDRLRGDDVAERSVNGVELRRVGFHRHRGRGGPELIEDYLLGARLVDEQTHVVSGKVRETSRLGGQLVGAGRQLLHGVAPLRIGLVFTLQAGFRVDDGNDGARYYRARRIRDRSRKGRRLPKQTRGKRYAERQYSNQFFHLQPFSVGVELTLFTSGTSGVVPDGDDWASIHRFGYRFSKRYFDLMHHAEQVALNSWQSGSAALPRRAPDRPVRESTGTRARRH